MISYKTNGNKDEQSIVFTRKS